LDKKEPVFVEFIIDFSKILLATCRDVLPIIILITVFQPFFRSWFYVSRFPTCVVLLSVVFMSSLALPCFWQDLKKHFFLWAKLWQPSCPIPFLFMEQGMLFPTQTGRPMAGCIFLQP